jgi:spermidine synthase
MAFWYDENFGNKCRFGIRASKVLFEGKSEFQQIDILETEQFGRVLAIDKIFMTSEMDEYIYHEMIVHPVLTTAPSMNRVLVIGGGDGGTIREVLSYSEVDHLTMVEIDAMVVEVSKRYLGTIGTAWDDHRLELVFKDGIDYVKNAEVEPFDIILLDGSDPVGPATGLFSEGFYRGVARLLKEDGIFGLQSESPLLQKDVFIQIGLTLGKLFPRVYPYFGPVPIYASGSWSWTYASRTANPMSWNDARVSFQEKRCKYYNRKIHKAAFAVPNNLRCIFSDGKVLITR